MKKRYYVSPSTCLHHIEAAQVLMTSTFDNDSDTQEITPTDDEYSGEFKGRRRKDVWDDEEEEEQN